MIRDKPIYLSYETWRVLKVLSKSESDEVKKVSIDEIADRIIGHALSSVIPSICNRLALQDKERDKTEKELIESLHK